MRSYCGYTQVLSRAVETPPSVVADLRYDLASLGYYTGSFAGGWTESLDAAIRSVRYDLTDPDSALSARYNGAGSVVRTPSSGGSRLEPQLARCLDAMIGDPGFAKLPVSASPTAANRRALALAESAGDGIAPMRFLMAIFQHETGARHFREDDAGAPGFMTLCLDRNDGAAPDHITSRGYGLGQHTLFRQPPIQADIDSQILDPVANAKSAAYLLRDRFDYGLVSANPALRANDRFSEWPISPLRLCKYASADPRYLSDCKACAAKAGTVDVTPGHPVYPGASLAWADTPAQSCDALQAAPDRTGFQCDWPYAVRRYNGGGIESYHYQLRVLLNLA